MKYDISIKSDEQEHLKLAMQFFKDEMKPDRGVIGYKIDKDLGILLYSHDPNDVDGLIKFPFIMDLTQAGEFVTSWLEKGAEYGYEPDIDGSCEKGFHLYSKRNGFDNYYHHWAILVVIAPCWIEYHK